MLFGISTLDTYVYGNVYGVLEKHINCVEGIRIHIKCSIITCEFVGYYM